MAPRTEEGLTPPIRPSSGSHRRVWTQNAGETVIKRLVDPLKIRVP